MRIRDRIVVATLGALLNVGASVLLDATWHAPRRVSDFREEAWGHSDYGFTAWTLRAIGISLIAIAVAARKGGSDGNA